MGCFWHGTICTKDGCCNDCGADTLNINVIHDPLCKRKSLCGKCKGYINVRYRLFCLECLSLVGDTFTCIFDICNTNKLSEICNCCQYNTTVKLYLK